MYGQLIHFRMKKYILIIIALMFSFESYCAFPVSEIDNLQSVSNNINIEHINQENTTTKAMTMEVVTMFVLAGLFLGIASIWLISKLVGWYNCADSMTRSQAEKNCSNLGEDRAVINLIGVLALLGFIFLFKGVNDYYKNKRSLKKQ